MANDRNRKENLPDDFGELLVYCQWCSVPACNHYVYHNGDECPEREATRKMVVNAAIEECQRG